MINKISLGMIVLLFILLCLQTLRFNLSELALADLRVEIGSIKSQSEEQKSRFAQAKKEADLELEISREKAKKIMLAKISPGCPKAIAWAIEQAEQFV